MATTKEAIEKLRGGTAGGGNGESMSTEDAIAALKKGKPSQTDDLLKMIDDIAMGGAQGIVKGVVGIPGTIGDVQQLIQMPGRETDLGNLMAALPQFPTSDYFLNKYAENVHPWNKTEGAGAVAERIGEFFTPTPGGKGKAIRDVATAVAGGGLSKAFEDYGNRLNLSPEWMSLLGGVLGVGAGQYAPSTMTRAVKDAAKNAPSADVLHGEKSAAYKVAEAEKGFSRQIFEDTIVDLAADLDERAILDMDDPAMAQLISKTLNKPSLSFNDVDAIAQRAGTIAIHGKEPKQREFNRVVREHLNKFYDKIEPSRPGLAEKIATAKELGRANLLSRETHSVRDPSEFSKTSEVIDEMDSVRRLLKSGSQGLRPIERKAGVRAVGRATHHSPLRDFGRAMQTPSATAAQLIGAIATPYYLGGEHAAEAISTAIGSRGAGYVAEKYADKITKKRLDDLEAVLRAGKGGQEKALAKANKGTAEIRESGIAGLLGAIRSQQAEQYERRKKTPKKKAGLPEVELPVVKGWATTEDNS